jgi:Lhr-like helicase
MKPTDCLTRSSLPKCRRFWQHVRMKPSKKRFLALLFLRVRSVSHWICFGNRYVSWWVLSTSIFVVAFSHVLTISVSNRDTPLPLIAQSLTYVADDQSKLPTLRAYLSQPYNPPVLIFTSSQPRATSLAEELVLNGIPNVDCLHAGMTKKERDEAVSRMRQGESWVMISTEVMARGMDFKGIQEVINYDFPRSVQSYVHRIGEFVLSLPL